MTKQELAYWLCWAGIKVLTTSRKNQIYVQCYKHEPRYSIIDLLEDPHVPKALGLNEAEARAVAQACQELDACTVKADSLLGQGCSLIPIHCDAYPRSLKKKLGFKSPVVLYAKGNTELLNTRCTAIVGARDADDVSLAFTQNVAKKAVSEGCTVVSGYARGVDRKALEAALYYQGSSIIVLPQGIETFSSGFKKHYEFIQGGRLLVISAFDPMAGWSVGYAMARNTYIYALSEKIYVAQSNMGGGTWSGAVAGLKRGDEILVRYPGAGEHNANLLLIAKGAKAVDINGDPAGA